jgi:transcription initiation factor TFIID subunit 11
MATSPPAPFSASLPNPKKRPSISSQASLQNAAKKPKLHPLRQTSFPVDAPAAYGSAITSARSETGSVTNSLVSATSAKRPRGRPRKSAQLQPDDIQAGQHQNADGITMRPGSSGNARGGSKSVVSAKSGAVEPDEEDEGEDIAAVLNEQEKDEERQAEENMYNLVNTFNEDQRSRHTTFRKIKLSTPTLRKLVNATVSQSVGALPLAALNHFSKYFVGEIVERARDVQVEYARAYEKTRVVEKKWRVEELHRLEEKQRSAEVDDSNKLLSRDIARLRREVNEYIPNPHRGGLLPDHLREALRRYRADGEGGGAGYEGLSHGLLGVTGSATWRTGDGATGKRLFR